MPKQMADGLDTAGKGFAPGKAVGEASLSSAVGELKSQHPQKWNDRGPHHGGNEHLIDKGGAYKK